MPAEAECDCTAPLLRSFRALHILHRNAQHNQDTRRSGVTGDFGYLMVVVVVAVVPEFDLFVVVVVGAVNWCLSTTDPIGWATK
jgi:hypothetical protein